LRRRGNNFLRDEFRRCWRFVLEGQDSGFVINLNGFSELLLVGFTNGVSNCTNVCKYVSSRKKIGMYLYISVPIKTRTGDRETTKKIKQFLFLFNTKLRVGQDYQKTLRVGLPKKPEG
jgi:hypothetical protein